MGNLKKPLIKRIINECKQKRIQATHDTVAFLISLLQLNPAYEINDDNYQNDSKIVDTVLGILKNHTRPSLTTLKNQLYFAKHYRDRDEVVKKHRLHLHQKLSPLIDEICETGKIRNARHCDDLYQKILIVITLLSGLGNPAMCETLREVTAALQSVFQPTELTHYVTLSKQEKKEQLMELMCIVAGIRLFNRDCQRGGEEIDDLPSILQDAIEKTHDCIVNLLECLMNKIYQITAVVERIVGESYHPVQSNDYRSERHVIFSLPYNIADEDYIWAVETLTASRQQEIYIRKLLSDVEHSKNETTKLMERLQQSLFKLHDTTRYRTAIPTSVVYPQFIYLADIWMGLQDEVVVLSNINSFLWELYSLSTKNVNIYDKSKLHDLLGDTKVLTDAERLELTKDHRIRHCSNCTLYYPDNTKDFDKVDLEFLGFCAWSFAFGKGALIPANPNNGIAKWRGRYYAFSSQTAARNFGMNPDRNVHEALKFVRDNIEYIHFFQLHEDIRSINEHLLSTDEKIVLKTCQDQNVQTDLHILPPFINKNYSSSIWELRRKALAMASISRCVTKSTQTHVSHFRNGVYVQAAPPKDKEVQTKKDSYTNTKKLLTFIFGLRGRRDDNQHVLSFLEDELEHL